MLKQPERQRHIGSMRLCLCASILSLSLQFGLFDVTTPAHAQSQPAPSAPANKLRQDDLRRQFQPTKDDDDGVDVQEAQELLYQWMDPRYNNDERAEISGIAAYFLVLGIGLRLWRTGVSNRSEILR